MTIFENKKLERDTFRKLRDGTSLNQRENVEKKVKLYVDSFIKEYKNIGYIAIYWPLKNEVDIRSLKKKFTLALPRCKDKKEEDRLYEIYKDLNELINYWNPTLAAVEKFFFYRSSTTISVVQARGVIMMVLASKKIHVSEYSPAQIKLTIAGSGKASKKDILDAVMYNLDLNKPPKPDDSADALAIALTKLNEEGFN